MMILIIFLVWWAASFLPPIVVHVPLGGMAAAMTIAPFILVDRRYEEDWTIKHEKRHVFQQRLISPPLVIILYLLISGVLFLYYLIQERNIQRAWWRCYFYNPFEIDARRNGGWYR